MILVILDAESNKITIVNAGHMEPICRHKDGEVVELATSCRGIPIGIMDGFDYEQAEHTLLDGDRLFLYTDGINETMDPAGKCFGIERVRDWMSQMHGDVKEESERLIAELDQFRCSDAQFDDMCMVCFSVG
jgi:serine phosphatase RsbU (regulator of sigma subunit)